MQLRFENTTLMAKFINETASSLVLVLTDVDSNSFTITLPNIKYSTGQPDTSGTARSHEHEFYCAVRLGKRYQHTNRQGITMELTAIYTRPLHGSGHKASGY